jgi:hypothetical protein
MNASASAQPVKLSLKFKIIWGIASLGGNLISGVFGALLPIFYQDYLGLSAKWIATASLIYGIWNAINDPVFGFLSDNTRSKKRQAHPLHALYRALPGGQFHPRLAGTAAGRGFHDLPVDAHQHDPLRWLLYPDHAGLFSIIAGGE